MLCTYASALILLNCVMLQIKGSRSVASPENLALAEQLCQSYAFSTDYAPFGNCHMNFALRTAYLVMQDTKKKAWIVRTVAEMGNPSAGQRSTEEVAEELDSHFDYLNL